MRLPPLPHIDVTYVSMSGGMAALFCHHGCAERPKSVFSASKKGLHGRRRSHIWALPREDLALNTRRVADDARHRRASSGNPRPSAARRDTFYMIARLTVSRMQVKKKKYGSFRKAERGLRSGNRPRTGTSLRRCNAEAVCA